MVPPSSVLAPNMENLRHWDSKEQDAADVVTHHSPLSPMDYDEGIAPDWSQATSKLYGRSNEEQVLLESYRRCISSSQELILITGHSGNGKTQLAKTLDKPEENMFLSGKFDVMQRSEPYKCFGQALTQWVEKVERRGTDVERIIRRIEQATDNGGVHQIIRQIAPGLSQLFPPATDMEQSLAYSSSMYAEKEILRTFCAMVAEMCSPEEPLVLFLDDLQWAEPASVDLLSALIRANIPGLVIVGACRGNEISSQHYFSCVLRELEADSVAITEIQLGNLEVDAVHEIICDLLSMPTEASNSLQMAEFLQRQTDGNIFFCLQLLRMLHEEGFLYAKYASTDSLAPKMIPSIQWTLDTHEYISSSRIPCTSTSSLLEDKLNAMDVKHRHVLQVACCLGAEFDLYLLSEIIKDNVIVENALNIASAKGLVIPQTHGTQWRFAHDSVQLAAYRLVEQGDPASFHLNLGRQLWSSLSDGELEMNLYLVADQYKLGLSKLESEDERNEVAGIFLAASKKGTSSSAFGTAAEYLETGISLLGNRHWRDQYDLSLELFNAAAENHHCCGNHAQVDNLIKSIQLHTRSFHDTLRSRSMQVLSLGARCRHAEALAVGLEVLSKLGYSFPKKARLFHVLISFLKTDRILRDKTDSDIMDLPIAADPDKVVAAQFFNVLFPYAMNADPLLSLLINLRHVRLTLKHGLSRMSCAAIGAHAMMLCNGLGRVDEGCRLAKLSVRLQEKFEAREWLARVNVAACAFTLPWNHSLKDMLQPLLSAHRAGIVSGDIEMASFAAVTRGNLGFHCGRNIQSMTAELFTMVDFMIQNKQDNILEIARPLLQVLINLSRPELCNNPLEGDVCDIQGEIDSIFGSKDKKEMTLSWLLYLKAVVAFLYGDYRTVIKSNRQIKTHDLPPFISANKLLMEGMSVLLLSKINSYSKPNLARRQARKCILQLQTLVRYCSTNYSHKVDLLEAELLAYDREYHQALQRFNKAAETAKKHGFLREEALAWERIYTLYPDNEKALETAIRVYEEWGCLSKVKQLEQKRDSQAELQRRLTLDSSEMKYS